MTFGIKCYPFVKYSQVVFKSLFKEFSILIIIRLEKMGIIFDIKRFALHDGPGIRTTVFFKGCPLNCFWCQNPESINPSPEKINVTSLNLSYKSCDEEVFGRDYSAEEIVNEIIKDRIFYEESGGGVTFSGGEPMLQFNFLKEVLIKCRELQVHTAIDTSGYFSFAVINEIYELTDLFLFDLKLIDDQLHKKYTGVSNSIILKNLEMLTSLGEKLILRIPLIPDITDTEENLSAISAIASTLKNIKRIDLLPYNEIASSKYRRFNRKLLIDNSKTQTETELEKIKSKFTGTGIEILIRG